MFETSSESETIIIRLAGLLAEKNFLLALVAGVVLAGILACTMSTADSQLLTAASSVSQNLLQDFLKIKMSPKQSMLAARLTVVGISLVAVVLAWNPDSSVFYIVSFAWAGFGAAFGPVVLFSLFWRRTNFQGALAGMLTGGVIGAFITYTVIKSFDALGPAKSALLIVVAQILVAYLIEVFGWFGVEKAGFEWRKAIGAAVAIAGIVIFRWE